MAAIALRATSGDPSMVITMDAPACVRRNGRAEALRRLQAVQLYFTFAFADDGEWSEAELDKLRSMRAAGKSYADCARALPGRTRNACISKAWRVGMYAPPAGDDPRLMLARMPTMAQRMRDWSPSSADVIAHPSAGKTFLDLGARDCRWPFGEGRHMRFCGREQEKGHAYCTEHVHLAAEPQNSVGPLHDA
jgi:hypothetical protein